MSDIKGDVDRKNVLEDEKIDTLTCCYPQRNCKTPSRYSTKALSRSRTDNEPSATKALNGEDAEK